MRRGWPRHSLFEGRREAGPRAVRWRARALGTVACPQRRHLRGVIDRGEGGHVRCPDADEHEPLPEVKQARAFLIAERFVVQDHAAGCQAGPRSLEPRRHGAQNA